MPLKFNANSRVAFFSESSWHKIFTEHCFRM